MFGGGVGFEDVVEGDGVIVRVRWVGKSVATGARCGIVLLTDGIIADHAQI